MLTTENVRKLVNYNPETGEMVWRISYKRMKRGQLVGCIDARGYRTTRILGQQITVHRLAFIYMGENIEGLHIDHLNHIKDDNRWSNLLAVDKVENERNRGMQSNNTSGYTGVTWHKQSGKWRATIKYNGKQKSLGLFFDKEEAAKAVQKFKEAAGYHPNHGIKLEELIKGNQK